MNGYLLITGYVAIAFVILVILRCAFEQHPNDVGEMALVAAFWPITIICGVIFGVIWGFIELSTFVVNRICPNRINRS